MAFLGALRGVGEGIPNFVVVDAGGKAPGRFFKRRRRPCCPPAF